MEIERGAAVVETLVFNIYSLDHQRAPLAGDEANGVSKPSTRIRFSSRPRAPFIIP